jgi:hypothetical protein
MNLLLFRQAPLPGMGGLILAACGCFPFLAVAQGAAFALPPAAAASAATAPDVFRRMNADNWVARVVTFADLGFSGPLVLSYPETSARFRCRCRPAYRWPTPPSRWTPASFAPTVAAPR